MAIADRRSIRRVGGVLLTALTLCLAGIGSAGRGAGPVRSVVRRLPAGVRRSPCRSSQFLRRSAWPVRQRAAPAGEASGFGHGTVYCVRTCDGRYFPLQRHAGATPAELCKSFCPAAKTMVFSGSKIDTAVAPNGTRYADLDNAFAYRDKVSDSCSCNGKDGLGLARVETSERSDAAAGRHRRDRRRPCDLHGGKSKTAEFTPISTSSSEWARRLSEVKVRPAPPSEKIEPVANDDTKPVAARAAPRRRAIRSAQAPVERPPRRRAKATRSIPAIQSRTDASRPGSPCCAGPSIMKSAAGSPGPVSFGRTPA